jgi:uncharacterized protein YdeI (YjbR/CyaY-like superfamily)
MKFFNSASTFRTWLAKHHRTKRELLVGFHKKHTGTSSVSYTEALDVALCYGWIDGVRRRVDDDRYTIRFTPRLPRSKWSAVNIKKANALVKAGLMQPAGAAAFAVKDAGNAKIYAYEVPPRPLGPVEQKLFRANKVAWAFFCAQPPGFRRLAEWRVMSAKKVETQQRRLAQLISACAQQKRHHSVTGAANTG